jgi:hypothetical protein
MACVELNHLIELLNALKLRLTRPQPDRLVVGHDNIHAIATVDDLLALTAETSKMLCAALDDMISLACEETVSRIKPSSAAEAESESTGTSSESNSIPSTGRSPCSPLPYEVDGFGSRLMMDDANVPSLLSLPLLGYLPSDHPAYTATREFVLSRNNPYWYSGRHIVLPLDFSIESYDTIVLKYSC